MRMYNIASIAANINGTMSVRFFTSVLLIGIKTTRVINYIINALPSSYDTRCSGYKCVRYA
jgi:hypothetical protein